MSDLWGLQFTRKSPKKEEVLKTVELKSIADPDAINTNSYYADYGVLEYNNSIFVADNESELIKQYRRLAQTVEISQMLTEIFNEVFILDVDNTRAFDIRFYDDCGLSKEVMEKISKEVDELYRITNFRKYGIKWFKDWYIDSTISLQVVINEQDLKSGIRKIVPVDPLKLKKVRVIPDEEADGTYDINKIEEYYLYNNTFDDMYSSSYIQVQKSNKIQGLKISTDAIVQVVSGERDPDSGKTIGFLHKTIVPYNNLKMMEESMIIYRVVRAPMRRVFYFDVSKLPPQRAEEYMKKQMKTFKTKFVYNSKTGTANTQNHISSMLEDYYLPRMSEGRTTEIQTIDGQSSQDIMDEIDYLKDKLFRSGNVPLSRLQDQQGTFVFGRSTEIQRDEYRFKKFLNNTRMSFMTIFDELLRRQLILKGIIRESEWNQIYGHYEWDYAEDNAFVEWKEAEQLNSRLEQLERIAQFSGKYVSDYWIMKNVMYFTDEQITEMQEQINKQPKPEEEDGEY